MCHALLIIRTPFQARLAEIALHREGISSFDLIFFTHHKSSKTLSYYEHIGKAAQKKRLIYLPAGRLTRFADLAFYFYGLALLFLWGREYEVVIFGSLDAPAVTGLATRSAKRLVTVDDGSANLKTFGSYFDEKLERSWIIRRITGAPGLEQVKALVSRHYTIFSGQLNAIDSEKLALITSWPPKRKIDHSLSPIVVYIGAAESIWLTTAQIREIRQYLGTQRIDFSIGHPMERGSLARGVPDLPHAELLAEEALALFPNHSPIYLVGAFSTVMLTTKELATRRTVLIPSGWEKLIPISEEAGCDTVLLSGL